LHGRHGGDAAHESAIRTEVDGFVDRLLDAARLSPNMTLVDVGSGDGVVAFRAIDRVGSSLRAILVDISGPLLRHAQELATQRSVAQQCEFLQCGADDLEGIRDACVDVVAMRAALAYVSDKRAALREFFRVLKPGGRISIAEPIFQDEALATIALKARLDEQLAGTRDPILPLLHRWRAAQFPDTVEKLATSSIANYSERDLIHFASSSGFKEIHLELHIDVRPCKGTTWEAFLSRSPHPLAPTAGAILAQEFTSQERQVLEQILRQTIEAGQSDATTRIAYLSASKPL
jgi:ubiquinone/menaquinone biosynthesis C-methylase UbiE